MPQDYIKDVLEGRSLSPEQDVTGTHIAPQKLPFSQGFAAMVGQGYYQNFFYSASSYLSKISYGIRAGSDAKQWVSPEKAKEEYGLNVDDFVPMKWAESAKGTRLKVERLQQIAQKSELAGDVVVPFLAQSLGYLADPTILATGIFNFKSAIGLGKVLSNVGRANRLAIQKASFIGTEATTLGASVLGEEFHATDIGLKESPEFKNVAFAVGLGLIPIGFAAKSLKKFSPPSRKELVKEADNIIEGILSGQRRDIRSALEGIKTSNLVDEGVPYITGSKRVSGMVESLTDIAEGGTKEASSFFDNFTNKVGKVFDELEKTLSINK